MGDLTARCELTDLLVVACSHCRGLDARERAEKKTAAGVGSVTVARFPGRCPCGEEITPGEDIFLDEDGDWLRKRCCGEGFDG